MARKKKTPPTMADLIAALEAGDTEKAKQIAATLNEARPEDPIEVPRAADPSTFNPGGGNEQGKVFHDDGGVIHRKMRREPISNSVVQFVDPGDTGISDREKTIIKKVSSKEKKPSRVERTRERAEQVDVRCNRCNRQDRVFVSELKVRIHDDGRSSERIYVCNACERGSR